LISALLIAFFCRGCGATEEQGKTSSKIIGLTPVMTIVDDKNFNYVVMANIYPEDRDTLFLTTRGGGLTAVDLSQPADPKVVGHWDAANSPYMNDLEGQDRIGDILVVVGRNGFLYLLDVSDPSKMRQIGFLDIPDYYDDFALLHVEIYQHHSGRNYALISACITGDLIAVDISDLEKPVFTAALETGVIWFEGIRLEKYLIDGEPKGYVFTGGVFSNDFKIIDVTNIDGDMGENAPRMQIVRTLTQPYYQQMVSETTPQYPNILFAALWGESGGLAAFDISVPNKTYEVSHHVSKDLARANRVKIQDSYAFLPLEQISGGGIGIIDISDPADIRQTLPAQLNIENVTIPYCLSVKEDYLYVFGTIEMSMVVMHIQREGK
jgi:hypothetical protein